MPYYTSSLYASVELFLVLTSSLTNGPIVGFSGSIVAAKSGPFWLPTTHSITAVDQLNLISSSLYYGNVSSYITMTSASTHVDIKGECENIMTAFTNGANMALLFSSSGITLT